MIAQLRHGHDFFGTGFGNTDPDRDAMRRVWEQHRETIIEQQARSNDPGRRASGWWEFDFRGSRDKDVPEAVQLARLGLLRGDEIQRMLETFARRREAAEKPYSNASWPVATGQALEVVGALSPTEIDALRENEKSREKEVYGL